MRLLLFSTIIVSMTFLLSAQNTGRGAATVPPAMTLTIPGFPDGGQIPVKFSQAAPGDELGQRSCWHAEFLPQHARHGSRPQQDY
jgi:hypothetical protein